jgi:hypothetical protein
VFDETLLLVADLYILLLNKSRSSSPPPSGREGIFFGVNGEHKLYDVYKVRSLLPSSVEAVSPASLQHVAKALVEVGAISTDEPTALTDDEISQLIAPPPRGIAIMVSTTSLVLAYLHDINLLC